MTFAFEAVVGTHRGRRAVVQQRVFDGKLEMTGGKYSFPENGQITFIYSNDVWVMEKK